MFVRGTTALISSAVDAGNVPVSRPWDALAQRCQQAAQQAIQAPPQMMALSQRLREPERYQRIQQQRRQQLEAFLWIEPNAAALERMQELISLICEEGSWSAPDAPFDDPAHPVIDPQAAETGVLFAWLLRRHGARLTEFNPRIPSVLMNEMRRRLFSPLLAHTDYPFSRAAGRCPALILADLLLSLLLMEKTPARRQQPVKLLLRLLDDVCGRPQSAAAPLIDRVTDACAIADLTRLLKRITRGELDLTRDLPPQSWLDDAYLAWIAGDCFFDPAGNGMHAPIAGADLYRLGYLAQNRPFCALGAQLHRACERPASSVTGRVLGMEYMRALSEESAKPPVIARGAAENGAIMLSRIHSLCAGIAGTGGRGSAGNILLFAGSVPILADLGVDIQSLPLIDGRAPLARSGQTPAIDADFGNDRDLMSADLTDAYPAACMLNAYQRTLMTLCRDSTVRLVDAFEFIRPPEQLCFRFVTAQRPAAVPDGIQLGPVFFCWDGSFSVEISELPASRTSPGGWLICLEMRSVPPRLICGFTFELYE